MSAVTRFYLKNRDRFPLAFRGQTVVECAMLVAAIAIVVFVTYQIVGPDIGRFVNKH